jgi:ISXO2-like transposase domain
MPPGTSNGAGARTARTPPARPPAGPWRPRRPLGFIHINTAENFYSILKRGIYGIYHHDSEAHLHRYLAEFDFRYSNRCDLGFEDTSRTEKALKGLEGKRLMYRQPDRTAHA